MAATYALVLTPTRELAVQVSHDLLSDCDLVQGRQTHFDVTSQVLGSLMASHGLSPWNSSRGTSTYNKSTAAIRVLLCTSLLLFEGGALWQGMLV